MDRDAFVGRRNVVGLFDVVHILPQERTLLKVHVPARPIVMYLCMSAFRIVRMHAAACECLLGVRGGRMHSPPM